VLHATVVDVGNREVIARLAAYSHDATAMRSPNCPF
jgi:hypothetical protein